MPRTAIFGQGSLKLAKDPVLLYRMVLEEQSDAHVRVQDDVKVLKRQRGGGCSGDRTRRSRALTPGQRGRWQNRFVCCF